MSYVLGLLLFGSGWCIGGGMVFLYCSNVIDTLIKGDRVNNDKFHQCPACGFWQENGSAVICDVRDCPEMAKERERPPLIIGDDEQPHYFGRP